MTDATAIARDYYDSEDADNFYSGVWGGEDIHIGLYGSDDISIKDASRKTVLHMARVLAGLASPGARVLDLGSGYGGAARVLAERFGAEVTCLNLSSVENERNRQLNETQGLSGLIDVIDGSFDDIPAADGVFDIVWSQDAILHAPDRKAVLKEVARVLKRGGEFIFTDPMQADGLGDVAVLQPIYDRIHLESLASPQFYRRELEKLGFTPVRIEEMTNELQTHYARVRSELKARRDRLSEEVSEDYIDRMLDGLGHWVDGAQKGLLYWGVMYFRKN
ncbi:MAG: methyltransferase domain-containing protein [Parvularculaceae bacterium]